MPQGLPPQVLNLLKSPTDAVLTVLAGIDEWQFDIFKLDEASNGWPLSTLAIALMRQCNLSPGRCVEENNCSYIRLGSFKGLKP